MRSMKRRDTSVTSTAQRMTRLVRNWAAISPGDFVGVDVWRLIAYLVRTHDLGGDDLVIAETGLEQNSYTALMEG